MLVYICDLGRIIAAAQLPQVSSTIWLDPLSGQDSIHGEMLVSGGDWLSCDGRGADRVDNDWKGHD